MDTFNLNNLWPSTNPANLTNNNQSLHHPALSLNSQFHSDSTINPSLHNQMPPHFFIPHHPHKFMDPSIDPSTAASFMNATCDLHDLLNRLNSNISASDLATQTRMFEAKHSTDVSNDQTIFPTSALSASTSSLMSENVHDQEIKGERTLLPQSNGFPTMGACVDEQQQFSSHSSPSSSSISNSCTTFPIMSSADNFLLAALNTLVTAQTSESELNGDNAGCSGDIKNVLLCQVCNDRASGLHYGVQSCEGCKGFFRRSIQQSISYRPCTKQQQCSIVRNNRNRCQACRLKKCLSVGMSRDAVRFGRVPKREKAKMAEEIQRASIRSQIDSMSVELEDDQLLATSIHSAYIELANCIQRDIINVPSRNFFIGDGAESLLNSSFYLPAIIAVVNFAKNVKGFQLLYQNDRIQLLKSSFFQILLLRLSTLKINRTELIDANSIPQLLFLNNTSPDDSSNLLRNSIIEFVQRFRLLGLDEQQQSLVIALVLCQSESTATQFQEASLAKMLQEKLWWLLQNSIFPNQQAIHSITGPVLIQSLFATFSDLKTLNSVYQEQMQNLRCYTISTPTQTSIENSSLTAETKIPEPKQTPRPKKSKINKPGDKLREKNKLLAELLEKPSQIVQFQNKVPKFSAIEEMEDDDQPLNLCVRDAQRANNSS